MARKVKLAAYVALTLLAIWFGVGFYRAYSQASVKPAETSADSGNPPARSQASNTKGRMMSHGAGLFVVIVAFGLLVAFDFTRFFGQKVEDFILDDGGEGERAPEYEEAEKVWANGNHLEAIQLMRDYLKANPREQYVALRIAEIYEKDLGNHLAAALEYEEVLQKKLPSERWGWAAIHLANLYSGKLNRPDDAATLLKRIIAEHPGTAAAKKARERLGSDASSETAPAASTLQERASNLPPGFRPKE